MRKIIPCLLLFLIKSHLLLANNVHQYIIIGTLPDSIDNIYIYLTPLQPGANFSLENKYNKVDSAFVRRGQFQFNGVTDTCKNLYSIWSDLQPTTGGWVVLEPGTITYNYQNEGSKGYTYARGTYLNNLLTDSILIPSIQLAHFGEILMSGNIDKEDPKMAKLIDEMRNYSVFFYKKVLSFIKENSKNPVGGYIFLMYYQLLREKDLNYILPNLPESIRQKYYKKTRSMNISKIPISYQYIPFSGKTPNGSIIHLADIIKQKKIILIDFWASWCTPCIKEIPLLTQIYKDYKANGLEIISISIDENELSWKKSIQKNNMQWIQIIDNKNKSDNIAEIYGVVKIPYTILINKNGKIISNNLRGQDLAEEIRKLME